MPEGPVRVGRFEWERLMMMSVPHPQNFKVLPIGMFMSADGGRIRPGNTGLAMFGPHEKTWAKLLRWAVDEGWLLLVQRGGARKGPGGTTVKRASVYAASVPQQVWERRAEILTAPPFRAAAFEGSAEEAPDPLKGASEGSSPDSDLSKGAPATPFNGPDPSMKGAPGDSLPRSTKGAIGVFEGSDPSFEGSAQGLPHHVVPSRIDSSRSSSSSSVVTPATVDTSVDQDGGGGGDSFHPDTEHAETLAASLDYRGTAPKKKQHQQLITRLAAALSAGWSERDLKTYLDLRGAAVRDAAAVYVSRLAEDELPDAERFRAVQGQAAAGGAVLPGDQNVADWMALSRDLKGADGGLWDRAAGRATQRMGYQPSNPNAVWEREAERERLGLPPSGADRVAYCGDPDCDPISRTYTVEDKDGLKSAHKCRQCHPMLRF
jgi:hypothetical protein